MFRYRMIRDTGRCWVDADLICLKRPDFWSEPFIFARQADAVSEELVNNAVLRLPADDPALGEMIATADAAIDRDVKWGALGPFLLTPVLQRHGSYARARLPRTFYPVEPEQFWKLFLPARRREIEAKIEGAIFLHLWTEAIKWSGWDAAVGPPPGSYLHEAFASVGALRRFQQDCGGKRSRGGVLDLRRRVRDALRRRRHACGAQIVPAAARPEIRHSAAASR